MPRIEGPSQNPPPFPLSEVAAALSYSASRLNLLKARLQGNQTISTSESKPPGMSKIENKRISCLLDYKKYVHAPPL
jgi:hypothetical protein